MEKSFTKVTRSGHSVTTVQYSLKVTGPIAEMLNKSVGATAGFTLVLIIILFLFGLSLYQLIAASFFVKSLFQKPKKDHASGRYRLIITPHLSNILKAFCIIYWILLILSCTTVSVNEGETHKASTPKSILDMSIVYLAFTAVVSVGVGFLTHRLWKTRAKDRDGKVTLNLSKTQLVFIKIAIVSEIVIFPLAILLTGFFLLWVGMILVRFS
jgi:hypothetical protein